MAYQISRFGRFESLESKKMMTGDIGIELGSDGADSTVETASIRDQTEIVHAGTDNQQTASGPSSSEIKKHSSKILKC